MKFLLSVVSLAVATASAVAKPMAKPHKIDSLMADSALGQSLISKARRLENGDDEIDFTWVSGFSIKFQGCHHINQWNEEADGEDDVRIETKRLVRFRLCPTNSCSIENAGGCNSGYGDYIIDMPTFLEAYFEGLENYNEFLCEYTANYECDCEDDDGKGDDFDREKCEWDCFEAKGIEDICADENPYEQDEEDGQQQEQFELRDYIECQNYEFPEDEDENNNRRKLDQNAEEEEVEYFMGPYCAESGGAIYLGLFTDDECTVFADNYGGKSTFKSLADDDLPYGSSSIVTMDCFSCLEPQEPDENNQGNDAQDEDQVTELCERIYATAGKCESGLGATGVTLYPNENACNYISGIKVNLKNGVITKAATSSSKTASIFIGIFVVAFVLLAAYVYYLKTKLDRASINLSD